MIATRHVRARGVLVIASALALSWTTAAAASSPPSSAAASDCPADNEINIVTNGDGRNINPILAVDLDSGWRTDLMYDPLVLVDPVSLEPIPWLAESWTISDDNRTYTFTLRQDAVFHDGEPVTAADVEFTTLAMLSPGYQGPFQSDWARLEGAADVIDGSADSLSGLRVIDDYTIEFTLTDPYAGFLTV